VARQAVSTPNPHHLGLFLHLQVTFLNLSAIFFNFIISYIPLLLYSHYFNTPSTQMRFTNVLSLCLITTVTVVLAVPIPEMNPEVATTSQKDPEAKGFWTILTQRVGGPLKKLFKAPPADVKVPVNAQSRPATDWSEEELAESYKQVSDPGVTGKARASAVNQIAQWQKADWTLGTKKGTLPWSTLFGDVSRTPTAWKIRKDYGMGDAPSPYTKPPAKSKPAPAFPEPDRNPDLHYQYNGDIDRAYYDSGIPWTK